MSQSDLRRDVSFLGRALGDCIREIEGEKSFRLIEEIRILSKQMRSSRPEAYKQLRKKLEALNPNQEELVIRAFNLFLNLTNIAEEHHRVRRKRDYEQQDSSLVQKNSLEESFKVVSKSAAKSKIYKAICAQRVELVLTAHPTESLRSSIVHKHKEIAKLLSLRDNPKLTRWEALEVEQNLERLIRILWTTEEIRRDKPTPEMEAQWGLSLVEDVLWRTIPRHFKKVNRLLKVYTGRELPLDQVPLRFASWMGGDRDGNPFVNAAVTRNVVVQSRLTFLRLLKGDLLRLHEDFSLNRISKEFERELSQSGLEFPYRVFLERIIQKLDLTFEYWKHWKDGNTSYLSGLDSLLLEDSYLTEELLKIYRSLCEVGLKIVADGALLDILRRVQCFGTSLLRLDLRQDSSVHAQFWHEVFAQLGELSYVNLSEDQKCEALGSVLAQELTATQINRSLLSEASRELLALMDLVSTLPQENFNCYIISMTEDLSDFLEVYALLHLYQGKVCLPIVPLFETVVDLENSDKIIARLFANSYVRSRLSGEQSIMIGYSDSSKRGGRYSSAWNLYQAQVRISKLGKKNKVSIEFFHGRGGSVGRGGGPSYLAIGAQPPGTLQGRMRVTEQGEVLRNKFGSTGLALRNLEIYTGSVLRAQLEKIPKENRTWSKTSHRLAELSQKAYASFVYDNEDFYPFYLDVTPEKELAFLKLGSRPKRRSGVGNIDSLRAIPWIFAWTQNRCLLPSWLGIGEALNVLIKEGCLAELRQMYKQWPFFRTNLDLVEMVLAKSDMGVFLLYVQELLEAGKKDLSPEIIRRFNLARKHIKAIAQHKGLLEHSPILRESIQLRNPYADPINALQVVLIKRLRERGHDAELERKLLSSINGVAAAMRNTG